MKKADNLRGKRVEFIYNGRTIRGTVVTHIRNGTWQVSSGALPIRCQRADHSRRIQLDRGMFTVLEGK